MAGSPQRADARGPPVFLVIEQLLPRLEARTRTQAAAGRAPLPPVPQQAVVRAAARRRRGAQERHAALPVRVCARAAPPLVGDYSGERVLEPFEDWVGFEEARKGLSEVFDLKLVSMHEFNDEALSSVDLLFCNPCTSTRAPSPDELLSLARFHAAGGTSLLNNFSLWSNNDDRGRLLVGPMGILPDPDPRFGPRAERDLPDARDAPGARELLEGPFGECRSLVNRGETDFSMEKLNQRMADLPYVRLTRNLVFMPALHHDPEWENEHLNEHEGLYCGAGLGQSLVSSNLHWVCQEGSWNGGLIAKADNKALLLNLAASSVRRLLEPLPN
eukprot:CAMPEP_0206279752 /NCGR_PEP_ID=MMETSP0047_2-20121206/38184_1 /ASSEMBLY_ACC=CAM_ASM_000192 /TAXON_ID=195065 /ORGANISM="Chroomonas mesostigmatica_cf, Strain CCMP1168" /LENGTH=329 /DNA_ID=CAMNT_0053709711 /DNA_START=139 /DNA_END=1129 /DNA_ORIENTATION=+